MQFFFSFIQGKILQSANDYIKGNNFWLVTFFITGLFISFMPRDMLFFRGINLATFSGKVATKKLLLLTQTNAPFNNFAKFKNSDFCTENVYPIWAIISQIDYYDPFGR